MCEWDGGKDGGEYTDKEWLNSEDVIGMQGNKVYVGARVWSKLNASICSGLFFFSSRRRHTRLRRDWSSDVCSSDLMCCFTQKTAYDISA